MKEDLVELGFCRSAHGLKGGFTFKLFNSDNSVLKNGSLVVLRGIESSSIATAGEEFIIEKIAFGNKVIVYLKGITDRNGVDDVLPFQIFFPRAQFPEDDDGLYLVDLIGVSVFEHGSDKEVGVIDSIYDNGMQDILVIKKLDNQKLELPFVDEFFPIVDVENNRLEIILPIEIE